MYLCTYVHASMCVSAHVQDVNIHYIMCYIILHNTVYSVYYQTIYITVLCVISVSRSLDGFVVTFVDVPGPSPLSLTAHIVML